MRAFFIGILALVFSLKSYATSGVQAQLSQVGDAIHIEFSGLNQWDYDITKNEKKNWTQIEIEIPRLSEPTVMALKKWKTPTVETVSVQHDGKDGKDIVSLRVKNTNIETFDYLTDQPSRLIIDIFQNQKSETKKNVTNRNDANDDASADTTNVETKNKKAKNGKIAQDKKNTLSVGSEKSRIPSSLDALEISDQGPLLSKSTVERQSGIFDGGDPHFERFQLKDFEIKEDSIIASKENYYIDFPMLRIGNHQLENLNSAKPVYDIAPKDSEENKQARLLLTLFENKRYLVFLKTVDWFYSKFPNSEYDEVIKYMWADVHFSLWLEKKNVDDFELSMLRYRQALEKYPNSPLVERTRMLMGFASLDRGDYLGTLRQFQNHIKSRPQSPNKDIARLAIAEAFLKLNRYKESIDMYDEIERDASNKKYQTQAAYFRGDVYYKQATQDLANQNQFFEDSIKQYQTALKKYPDNFVDFPSAYYNQASAYFHLQKPKESLGTYLEFLKRFPNHSYAGYAMTRVGELMETLGADKSKVMGAYLETQFRYGDKPGSVVARLRLLSSRMRNMKPTEVDHSVKEIMQQVRNSNLDKIEQFANVIVSDGYASRKEFDRSVDLLVKFYQSNPTTVDTQLLKNRIVKYLNMKIKDQVDAGQFISALQTHNKYSDSWLKTSDRIDTKYNVGRAFELAGAFVQSEKLYRDTLNKILSLKGTPAEKERNIFEKLPTLDELYLRLAQSELQLGHHSESYEYMKLIKSPESLSEKNQIERVQLGAVLLEKKGDFDSAARYLVELIKTWKGEPVLVSEPYYQLAQIEIKSGKKDDAIKSLEKIDQLMSDSENKVSASLHSKSLEQMADIYFEKNDKAKALKAYEHLLEKYETSKPLSSIRYKVGKMYFERGEIQKAADVWNKLKAEKNDLWYKLAQEQLKNSDWGSDYKKYIKRIPAMSERN